MLKLIGISILTFSMFLQLGQSKNSPIEVINMMYLEINSSIEKYEKRENFDISLFKDSSSNPYSVESTKIHGLAMINLIRYYDNGKLRKAIVEFDSEKEDQVSEYYYSEGIVFFVQKTKNIYDVPKWSQAFDAEDKKIEKEEFYFENESLIKWDKIQRKYPAIKQDEKKMEALIISDSKLYLNVKE